ncbi:MULTISPECIES: hypothetical protein [Candidatus Rhabdochlamydia]|uniref:hypothetical protein n=1 Tax=Candidatus Rhabdochlamydia oedothoracis TaxID=2720720 RepID=UPI001BFC0075|nr:MULTISPECIES: hypothetical protein [Rhabdochlamydia]
MPFNKPIGRTSFNLVSSLHKLTNNKTIGHAERRYYKTYLEGGKEALLNLNYAGKACRLNQGQLKQRPFQP